MTYKPLDMPDDYPLLPGSDKSPSNDIGELAVRLGSIVSYDRRGVVIFQDNFDYGISKYNVVAAAAGSGVNLSAERCLSSGFSCELKTASATNGYTSITRTLHPLKALPMGFEVSFSEDTGLSTLVLTLLYQKDGISQSGIIKYNFATHDLSYQDSLGNFIVLDNVKSLTYDTHSFNTLKFVIDPNIIQYVRVLFNNREYDLSGIDMFHTAVVLSDRIIMSVAVNGDGVNSRSLWVDNLIVTIGEL